MGRRRLLTALLALVLALTGAVLLTSYVRGADARALAGATATPVLVVTKAVPQGTTVADLASRVQTKMLPAVAVAPGTLSTLGESGGRVTAVDLQPGEQLMASRLIDPATLQKPDEVTVPAGLQELSISLDPQRVLGGRLAPGDRVGVLVSLAKDDLQPATTTMTAEKVLVVRVGAGGTSGAAGDGSAKSSPLGGGSSAGSSSDGVLVTLAVDTTTAEKIVYGADNGSVWLTRQPDSVPSAAPKPLSRKDVEQ